MKSYSLLNGFVEPDKEMELLMEQAKIKSRNAVRFMCKGEMEDKLTTFMVDLGNCIVIVRNVPSHVCRQCGEVSYSDEVSDRLEKIVDKVMKAPVEISISNDAA